MENARKMAGTDFRRRPAVEIAVHIGSESDTFTNYYHTPPFNSMYGGNDAAG